MQDFIMSKVRVKLLTEFLSNPAEMFYIRQLTRTIDEEINAVRRELIHLTSHGLLKELVSMVGKASGLGLAISKTAPKLGHVKFVMISGRFMRQMPRAKDTVDLLLVGDIILPQLADLIREQEAKLSREINYTVMTADELSYRKTHNDPFIARILEGSRVMIIGDEEDLVA
jgi:hypothetical protein